MNKRDILIGSAAMTLIGGTGPAALAGSYATNTYVNTVETGHRDINVVNVRKENGHTITDSGSLKFETNFPNAQGKIVYDGYGLKGEIRVSTDGPDPFVEGVYSNQVDVNYYTDFTKVNINEGVDYTSTIYTHTIEAGGN